MTRTDGDRAGGDIGLLDAVAIEVGLIVGGALFALVGVGVALSGAGVAVSFVVAMAVAVLGLVPTAMLGAAFPTTCGHYRYPERFLSPSVAFLGAWGLGVSMFAGGLPLYALTAGEYAAELHPMSPRLAGVAFLTVFFVLNLVGIRFAAGAQLLMFVGLLAGLGAFVVFGLPAVDPGKLSPVLSEGPVGVLAGAGVLYFTCLGANFVVDLGGDLRDATVTIPRSFLVTVPLVTAIYVLVGVVAVGTVGVDGMANETLMLPASRLLPAPYLTLFVGGGALFAVATTLNATYILVPRYAKALADDGLFPAALGVTNDRFGTAHWALLWTYVLTVAMMFAPLPFQALGTLLAFGGALVVTVVSLAALAVWRDPPRTFDSGAFPVPTRVVVGMAALAVPANLLLVALLASQSPRLFVGWLAALGVGLAYYGLRTNYYPLGENAPTEYVER